MTDVRDAQSDVSDLIRRAQGGDADAWGELLEGFRAYLKILAKRTLDGRLAGRIDASDIVQQTFLSAHKHLDQFRGEQTGEFVAWLVRILERNLQEAARNHLQVQKRAVDREARLDDSQRGLKQELAVRASSPSQKAMRGEEAVRLARCLAKLPDDQQEVVRLKYLEGRSLAEIVQEMQKTPSAIAGLLKRGMQKLRTLLKE